MIYVSLTEAIVRKEPEMAEKIKLYGLTTHKTLSFNIYDVCYANTEREKKDYVDYIDEQYNAERLTNILCDVTDMIGAHVLNISKQNYDPQGASVTILISEMPMPPETLDPSCNSGLEILSKRESVCGHLDKSHLTVHTYPEFHPNQAISTFRVDIDVSTCGKISPLVPSITDPSFVRYHNDRRSLGFTREMDGAVFH